MPNALIYCRVSTEEQAKKGYSLDAQEKICRSFAIDRGFSINKVFRDEGKSATTINRPGLKDLMAKCKDNRSVDAVIVQETDRLARNTQDHLAIKAILSKQGIKVISVAQPMLDDSPEGNLIDTIIASVNQFQSDINSRKTKKGLQQRFDEGWWPGWAPLGYMNISINGEKDDRRAKRIIKNDPERWALLREGFKLYLSSKYSVDEVNDKLYNNGLRSKTGKKISHSIMTCILKNPFYAGIMKWNGQEKIGNHQPMISLFEHRKILDIMKNHNNYASRRRKHDFLLRGLLFCNICGQRYTAEKHPAKMKEYYHCAARRKHSNRGQNVEVSELDRQVAEEFKNIQLTPDCIELIAKKLKEYYLSIREGIDQRIQSLQNKKLAIQERRNRAETKLLDGILSDDAFSRQSKIFETDLNAIQNQICKLDSEKKLNIELVQEAMRFTQDIYKTYITAPLELKRMYLGLCWDRFYVQDKQIIRAEPTKLFKALLQEQKVIISSNWLPSPSLIITLQDEAYMRSIEAKLTELKRQLSKVA